MTTLADIFARILHGPALLRYLSGRIPYIEIQIEPYFDQGDLVILKISDPIPQEPFVARNDIRDYDVLRIEDAFFTVEDRDSSLLNTLGIGGFAKVEDNSYDFLIPIANDLGISLSELG